MRRKANLNYFEKRVLRNIDRFDPLYRSGIGPTADYAVDRMSCVSDWALAILKLRARNDRTDVPDVAI